MSENKFMRTCVRGYWFCKWQKGTYAYMTAERPTAKKIQDNLIEELDAMACEDIKDVNELREMAIDHLRYLKEAFGSVERAIAMNRGDII